MLSRENSYKVESGEKISANDKDKEFEKERGNERFGAEEIKIRDLGRWRSAIRDESDTEREANLTWIDLDFKRILFCFLV